MPRLEFNTIAPLLTHILESATEIDLFLNDMTMNAEVSIPTLPMRHCKAAIITIRTLAEAEALFPLAERHYFKIHSLSVQTKKYTFRFAFTKRIGTIEGTDNILNDSTLNDFAAFIDMIPGAELRAVN